MRDELVGLKTEGLYYAAYDRLHAYIKLQLDAVAFRKLADERAFTPKVQADIAIDPKMLTGFVAGHSTPTSAVFAG